MSRLPAIDPSMATGKARSLLDGVQNKLGLTPNMMRVMANSPAVLKGYLDLNGALASGSLSAQLREQIALTVAEANGCDYCLAAHAAFGRSAGLDEAEIFAARRGIASDPGRAAALSLARALVEGRGRITDVDVDRVRVAGYSDGEILEIIAEVSLNVLTNYVNMFAQTEVDFPGQMPLEEAA